MGTILRLAVADLVAYGVPEGSVCQGLWRHNKTGSPSWSHIKNPADQREALIDYDHIPATTIRRYGIPGKADLLQQLKDEQTRLKAATLSVAGSALVALHERTVVASDYNYYFTQGGLTATPEGTVEAKALQLMDAAGWLRLLVRTDSRVQLRSLGFEKKEQLREAVLREVLPLHLYGLRVSNVRVLQQKELAFGKALEVRAEDAAAGLSVLELREKAAQRALLTLVPKRAGVRNAQKIGKIERETGAKVALSARIDGAEWHARTVLGLFMNPGKGGKFDLKEVHRRYCRACDEAGQVPVGLTTMKRFLGLDEVRLHTAWERDGHAALEKFLPHQRRERPTYSLSKGGYDGFSVDFYTSITKADGTKATVMLTVVAVFDFHSEAITGYAVGLVENGKLVRDMYRNHLQQMGGLSFIEIESDRFSGNVSGDSKQLFERACQYVTQPKPNDPRKKDPNPKARLAERLLQELNRLTQSVEGWKGTNITSIDPQRKANPDYAGEAVQPTLAVGIRQINKLVALYNHQPLEKWNGQTRWQRLQADFNPEAVRLDALTQATLLSQHTVVTVRHAAVSITVAKKEYVYEFPTFAKYTHKMGKGMRVRVYYDETDLSSVDVFGFADAKDPGTDVHLVTLKRGQKVQMAKAEQTHGDLVVLGKQEMERANLRDELDRKQLEVEAALYGLEIPGGMPLKSLKAMVLGARLQSTLVEDFDTRYADVLGSDEATRQLDYYDDRLLRDEGLKVPVMPAKAAPKQGLTARERKDLYAKKGYDFS